MRVVSDFLLLLLFVLCLVGDGTACYRRSNARSTYVVAIGSIDPDIAAPTPSPTTPPPAPPIPVDWQIPKLPLDQQVVRSNCEAETEFSIPSSGVNALSRTVVTETWVYSCQFQVYVEIQASPTKPLFLF